MPMERSPSKTDLKSDADVNSVFFSRLLKTRRMEVSTIERIASFVMSADSSAASELEIRKSVISKSFDKLSTIREEILCATDDADIIEETESIYANAEHIFCKVISKIELLKPSSTTTCTTLSASETVQPSRIEVKLPTINLPTFSGKLTNWLSYHDNFVSLIHNNSKLSDVQKFHYLKSSLQDDALRVVESLDITNANYTLAWKLLKNRFQNNRIIVNTYVQSLFSLPVVPTEALQGLRNLVSSTTKIVAALEHLQQPVNHWDTILINIVTMRLDHKTLRAWEETKFENEFPKFDELINFLNLKCQMLEAMNVSKGSTSTETTIANFRGKAGKSSTATSRTPTASNSTLSKVAYVASYPYQCPVCPEKHSIYSCSDFLKLSTSKRIDKVTAIPLCTNCLRSGHQSQDCQSSRNCKHCNERHHSLLHSTEVKSSNHATGTNTDSILATAVIMIQDSKGTFLPCRALLDTGSQSNFITKSLAQKLGLKPYTVTQIVGGIFGTTSTVQQAVFSSMKSRISDFEKPLEYLMVESITNSLPVNSIDSNSIPVPKSIILADALYHQPAKIDILLGIDICPRILLPNQIDLGANLPLLQDTHLGWIVWGNLSKNKSSNVKFCNVATLADIEQKVEQFWSIEEITDTRKMTADEITCENHFVDNHSRNSDGRFVVKLPLKSVSSVLGDSERNALLRFNQIEKRMTRDKQYREMYIDFMAEYLKLGHMEEIVEAEDINNPNVKYYIPHHAVLKPTAISTKLRTVFDASSKSTTGISLNDILYVGPTIQSDLFSIVLRFRCHQFVITADITKMYRQIQVDSESADLQRILWRNHPSEEIKKYRLKTVTYGTAAAPFLSVRCLKQLAHENMENYPDASSAILEDFYVDDLMTGDDTIEKAMEKQCQIINILQQAKLDLHKWCSNHPSLLASIPDDLINEQSTLKIDFNDTVKALGLYWQPNSDIFLYKVQLPPSTESITKRIILSETAAIFDPLSFVGPVIVVAKIILQKLWSQKIGWDEEVSEPIRSKWIQFRSQLPLLNNIQINRCCLPVNPTSIQLHGFADASESAYGACLYVRVIDQIGNIHVNLLCAKSRIAPLKATSLPRLELCAALVLSKLYHKVSSILHIKIENAFLWSDSQITLGWIRMPSVCWKTFVANKVEEIQQLTKNAIWNHVKGFENPADIISRGSLPADLGNAALWWNGPHWLNSNQSWHQEESTFEISNETPERKQISLTTIKTDTNDITYITEKFSSFSKTVRVAAYVLRFINNFLLHRDSKETGRLSVSELSKATNWCLMLVQKRHFSEELKLLSRNQPLNRNSRLIRLNPFIDDSGILRVGGRLQLADLPFHQKHPAVLPNHDNFTKLIAKYEHLRGLHKGPQSLLYAIRLHYWPLGGRQLVRAVVHNCKNCFKVNPKPLTQFMGNLPSTRLQPCKPFINIGLDYCGPILIKSSNLRKAPTIKTYICVFVCMVTKAIHLELVSDMTTDSFLAALRRMMARRGKCTDIFSDNGSNFLGAHSHLQELSELLHSKKHQTKVDEMLNRDQITWHFIPPRSPNFGGLWEAGVKSVKGHLKKTIGNALLTFEECYTVLTVIESCLNSRPLTPASSDPNDLQPLTPGHFLTGAPMDAIIERDLMNVPVNRLNRWQHVQQIYQHIWARWSTEYLNELQQRTKWNVKTANLEVNTMVLLQNDNLPPLQWAIGRVVELHPGADGLVRVASIRTSTGTYKRPISKLCPLPIEKYEEKY